jgi:hypothetical protein
MRISTREDAEHQGWLFSDQQKECSRCGQLIVWARRGEKNASFIPDTGQFHLKVCGQPANAAEARYAATPRRPALPSAPTSAPAPVGDGLRAAITELTTAVRALLAELKARRAPEASARARFDQDGCPQ